MLISHPIFLEDILAIIGLGFTLGIKVTYVLIVNLLKLLQNILGHVESSLKVILNHLDLFLRSFLWPLVLHVLQHSKAVLGLLEID